MAFLPGPSSLAVSGFVASMTMLSLQWPSHLVFLTSIGDKGNHELPETIDLRDAAVDEGVTSATVLDDAATSAGVSTSVIAISVTALNVVVLALTIMSLRLRVDKGYRSTDDAPQPSPVELPAQQTVQTDEGEHNDSMHFGSPTKRFTFGKEDISAESIDMSTEDDTTWLRRRPEDVSTDSRTSFLAAINSEEEFRRDLWTAEATEWLKAERRVAAEAKSREGRERTPARTTWRTPPRVLNCLGGCVIACDETVGAARSVMLTRYARGICRVPVTCTACFLGLVHALVDGLIHSFFEVAGEEPIELTLRRGSIGHIDLSTICEGDNESRSSSACSSPIKPSPIKLLPTQSPMSRSSGAGSSTRSPRRV